jgi:hypothetical protein
MRDLGARARLDSLRLPLTRAGVKTGDKKENAVFHRIDRLADADLHPEGFYKTAQGVISQFGEETTKVLGI